MNPFLPPARVPLPAWRPDPTTQAIQPPSPLQQQMNFQQQQPMTQVPGVMPPPQATPQQRGFMPFLHNNADLLLRVGAGLLSGKTGPEQWAGGASALATGVKARNTKNKTLDYLKTANPELAQAVESGAIDPATAYTFAIKQKMAQSDPMRQLDMQYKQAQIAHLTNPQASAHYGQSPIILTDPNNKMHMGQMSSNGGMLIDGQHYDTLPANWKVGTVSQSGSGGLSPQTLDILATQYLAGDKSAIQGFSRNANMRAQLANAIAKKANEMGMDGKSIAAEISAYGGNVAAQRSAGTRAAQVGMAASEANKMADVALEASKAVPRGAFVPWNKAVNAYRTGTSSPQMAAFVTATTSLVNAYARAVSPLGAPTDAMRQHAEQMLNTAQSPQAYEAVINQMKKEMEAALHAPAEISGQLKEQITGRPAQETPAAPAQDGGWTDLGNGVRMRKVSP